MLHWPELQLGVPCALLHTAPQPPQLLASSFVSHPTTVLLQSRYPISHLPAPQTPAVHTAGACMAVHGWPHAPQ